ncbi:aldehyde dehydrogenase family protein [Tropicimonas sp. IMCC34011]|uniref:aldehyde dehydrogenase family protein n=1 Tax=Tropicimonas sp. IMCC34011 TaxID=2248759 RepID=UPI00130060B1|nr:aldehyde dehydrogenase family protein [Tropicimonas sp. IMCC34011]
MTIRRLSLPQSPREFSMRIGGKVIAPRERDVIERANPAHGTVVSRYPRATPDDAKAAIAAAREAFDDGRWSRLSGAEREATMREVIRLIEENRAELREIEALETGKPIGLVDREMGGTIAHWTYAATLARHTYGDTYDTLGGDSMGLIFREPVGVVSLITPWNYPLMIASQKLPFALAVGCTAILKPSELTSGTSLRLAELLVEAGMPEGVVTILPGYGQELGETLCTSDDVDMVSFTGSTRVGRIIGRQAGEGLKKVSLELGGKGAHIVMDDADLEAAAAKVALGATRNAGQACVSGSRLVVDRSIAKNFVDAVIAEIETLKVGDPLDPETTFGPLVSDTQKSRVEGYIASGDSEGATRRWTMDTPDLPGHFVRPTVFTDVASRMTIAQDEIFGPVLSVIEVDGPEEAIHVANDTPYGLAAGLWTRDIDRGLQMARKLKVGTVEMNTFLAGAPELPLSGHGASGTGHERGRFAVEEFTHLKTIQVQLGKMR